MPTAGSLTPPSEPMPGLRHSSTAPNLRFMIPNRYANLDADSPAISPSPPPSHTTLPMKFFPLPSKYGQLTGASFSNISLSTSPKRDYEFGSDNKASFTVGHDDSHDDYSHMSKLNVPSTVIHSCDTPVGSAQGTPAGSPSLLRRALHTENHQHHHTVPDGKSGGSTGFLAWLTRPGSAASARRPSEEPTFFHQKEDMSIVQGLADRHRLGVKPMRKLPVSMSDVNVFTPNEF